VSERGKPCRAEVKVGEFTVQMTASSTAPGGYVQDGVTPMAVWTEFAREGDCAILERPIPFCDPPCEGTQTCGLAGVCVEMPVQRSVGAVTITGLSASVSMTPDAITNGYNIAGTIPQPGFTEGAAITLSAAGDVYGPFSLSAQGVAALTLTSGAVTVAEGTAITLTWRPPAQPANGRIYINLNLSSHGTNSAALECDVADTGSYQIPGTLLTRLLSKEVAGYPTLTVARRTADSITIQPGCVDLLVQAVVESTVPISGMTFCPNPGETADCPAGQTCQANLICG
jgi:hypothetical protein